MVEDDLGMFFDVGDFAVECTRRRAATADVVFAAILASTDEDALDGHAITGVHHLHYATEDVELQEGDRVVSGGHTYKVRRADRVNDGRESVALLRRVGP
jgi:hypothetical protein